MKYFVMTVLAVVLSGTMWGQSGSVTGSGTGVLGGSTGFIITVPYIGQTVTFSTNNAFQLIPAPKQKLSAEALLQKESSKLKAAHDKLHQAEEDFEQAKEDFENVQNEIKRSHGQQLAGLCEGTEVTVTLWGDYALIDSHAVASCVAW